MSHITAYLDHVNKEIESQLEYAKKLSIKQISMRFFDDHTLKDLTSNSIKPLVVLLKKEKLTLGILDASYPHPIVGFDKEVLKQIFANAEALQTKTLLLDLPSLDDFDLQHDLLLEYVKWVMDENKKKHFQVVFKMNPSYKPGIMAFLVNNFKAIKLQFDCGLIYEQKASVTTTYRILKKNTEVLSAYDIDKLFEPALLGYGQTGILDIAKKMKRDGFKGYVVIDTNLIGYLTNKTNPTAKKKWLGLFSRDKKTKKKYDRMDEILGIAEGASATYEGLIEVYKSVLEKILA